MIASNLEKALPAGTTACANLKCAATPVTCTMVFGPGGPYIIP